MNKRFCFATETNNENDWREQAKALFFVDHMGVSEISVIVKKARETISRFLNECDGYDMEMEFRKSQSEKRRRDYKRQWDRLNRPAMYEVTKESLRREHETAVKILSSEKY